MTSLSHHSGPCDLHYVWSDYYLGLKEQEREKKKEKEKEKKKKKEKDVPEVCPSCSSWGQY